VNFAWYTLKKLGLGIQRKGVKGNCQESWLMECLGHNRSTIYGQRYQFAKINSIQDFRHQVPLVTYDDVAPYIDRMAAGESDILFKGRPVAFERTSGTTKGSKLIPYSERSLKDFRIALLPWLANAIQEFGFKEGSVYSSISPATRKQEITAGGIPVGLPDAAYLGCEALSAFSEIVAIHESVGGLLDITEWQLMTLYWLLCRSDIELISVWSPTFFLVLMDALESRKDELETILKDGMQLNGHELEPNIEALNRLNKFSVNKKSSILWPRLKLVSCWADASSAPFFEELKQRLPHSAFQAKGLLSSEGVVTVPHSSGHSLLAVNCGFFEFLDEGGNSKLAHEVVPKQKYEVVITTSGGLYRYRTGDLILCEKFVEDIPALRFMGRRGLTSDLVGEKLTEEFAVSCLEGIRGFRMLVPTVVTKPHYVLVIDECIQIDQVRLIQTVEDRLLKNPQYSYARRMRQLEDLEVLFVAQPLEKYVKRCMENGTRMGDVKVSALRHETDWLEIFTGVVL